VPPETYNNPEYDAAAYDWQVKRNINPISGVSARHRKKLEAELKAAEGVAKA